MRNWAVCVAALMLADPADAAPKPSPVTAPPVHGDLEGVWTNAWYTNLQRPKDFKALVATPQEAEAYEAPRRALRGMLVEKDDETGQAEAEFNDKGPGLARIRGEIRSSWIVDPVDGRLPYASDVRQRLGIGQPPVEKFDNVEDRPTDERCLTATGAGAPILNSPDTNTIQIVQTPGDLVIVSEKNHDARVIRMGATLAAEREPRDWMGLSIGHWRGKTLVVETTLRRAGLTRVGGLYLSGAGKVTEEFTRTGAAELTYVFTVEDFSLYTQRWRGEMVFRPAEGAMYEYACHEGNYALASILSAARQSDAAAVAKLADEANAVAKRK